MATNLYSCLHVSRGARLIELIELVEGRGRFEIRSIVDAVVVVVVVLAASLLIIRFGPTK